MEVLVDEKVVTAAELEDVAVVDVVDAAADMVVVEVDGHETEVEEFVLELEVEEVAERAKYPPTATIIMITTIITAITVLPIAILLVLDFSKCAFNSSLH